MKGHRYGNRPRLSQPVAPRPPPLRPRITLVHASILVVIGVGFALNAIAGGFWGVGAYPFLITNHIGAVGLVQAYLLMSIVGASIWIGFLTARPPSRAPGTGWPSPPTCPRCWWSHCSPARRRR